MAIPTLADSRRNIERLIEMRKEVGVLRRALAAHRSALVALMHPELEALGNNASGERFQTLLQRFESTVQGARDAKESIVGSFEVLIARTGHRTNDIMKVRIASTSGSSWVMSLRLPPVSEQASGVPRAQAIR